MHQGDCPPFSIVALPTTSFVVAPVVRSKKKKRPHTSATIATPPQCRQWSNQMLLPCGALLAVRDGLKTAVRASGRFLRRVVFLCKGNSFFHGCTAILRLVHDADSGSAQSVQTLDFLSALVASHLSLKKALRALTTAC